jgi:hypothetical protein
MYLGWHRYPAALMTYHSMGSSWSWWDAYCWNHRLAGTFELFLFREQTPIQVCAIPRDSGWRCQAPCSGVD